MADQGRRRATYEDLLAVPEGLVAEILDGELYTQPRPRAVHASATSVLGAELSGGPGGWWIVDEPEVHLDRDVVVPDLAGWRRERMPHLPDSHVSDVPPDWVCEVLSPGTARRDRMIKMRIYARAGVGNLWLVDPDLMTLEAFRREGSRWLLLATHGGEEVVRAEPFDAVAIELAGVFER
jgi:Uma2 family endonuclease